MNRHPQFYPRAWYTAGRDREGMIEIVSLIERYFKLKSRAYRFQFEVPFDPTIGNAIDLDQIPPGRCLDGAMPAVESEADAGG